MRGGTTQHDAPPSPVVSGAFSFPPKQTPTPLTVNTEHYHVTASLLPPFCSRLARQFWISRSGTKVTVVVVVVASLVCAAWIIATIVAVHNETAPNSLLAEPVVSTTLANQESAGVRAGTRWPRSNARCRFAVALFGLMINLAAIFAFTWKRSKVLTRLFEASHRFACVVFNIILLCLAVVCCGIDFTAAQNLAEDSKGPLCVIAILVLDVLACVMFCVGWIVLGLRLVADLELRVGSTPTHAVDNFDNIGNIGTEEREIPDSFPREKVSNVRAVNPLDNLATHPEPAMHSISVAVQAVKETIPVDVACGGDDDEVEVTEQTTQTGEGMGEDGDDWLHIEVQDRAQTPLRTKYRKRRSHVSTSHAGTSPVPPSSPSPSLSTTAALSPTMVSSQGAQTEKFGPPDYHWIREHRRRRQEEDHEAYLRCKPCLGVEVCDAPDNTGCKILTLRLQGPAHRAGIKADDLFTKVNDNRIRCIDAWHRHVGEFRPFDVVVVSVQRTRKGTTRGLHFKVETECAPAMSREEYWALGNGVTPKQLEEMHRVFLYYCGGDVANLTAGTLRSTFGGGGFSMHSTGTSGARTAASLMGDVSGGVSGMSADTPVLTRLNVEAFVAMVTAACLCPEDLILYNAEELMTKSGNAAGIDFPTFCAWMIESAVLDAFLLFCQKAVEGIE